MRNLGRLQQSAAPKRSYRPIRLRQVMIIGLSLGSCAGAVLLGAEPVAAASTLGVVATVVVPDGVSGVAVDPSTHRVYVPGGNTLSVIDESGGNDNGRVLATIGVGAIPDAAAVDSLTHNVFVANEGDGTLSVVDESGDANSGKVTATIRVGTDPSAVAVDPSTHDVFVANGGNGTVSVVDESGDANNGKVISTIAIGGPFPDAAGIAIDPSNHNVYVTNLGGSTVSVIDESGGDLTGKVTATIDVGADPEGIAVDPTTHSVYVAAYGNSEVSVIDESGDANTGHVTNVNVPGGSIAVAVNPSTHNVYVTNAANNTVSVIDGSGPANTAKVSGTIGVGRYPEGVAVDPSNRKVFVANGYGTVSVIGPVTAPASDADLALAVTGPSAVADGTSFTETVTVSNNGPSSAWAQTDVVIPEGLTVTFGGGARRQGGLLVWTDANVPWGASITHNVHITAAAHFHGTVALGGATISQTGATDQNPVNNAAIATIKVG